MAKLNLFKGEVLVKQYKNFVLTNYRILINHSYNGERKEMYLHLEEFIGVEVSTPRMVFVLLLGLLMGLYLCLTHYSDPSFFVDDVVLYIVLGFVFLFMALLLYLKPRFLRIYSSGGMVIKDRLYRFSDMKEVNDFIYRIQQERLKRIASLNKL